MNSQIKQILKLNRKFYQLVSKDFSKSRQSAWKGWERAVDIFLTVHKNGTRSLKILDLGCGNGRFAGYISGKIGKFTYKGYDINNDLLFEARKKYKNKNGKNIVFVKKEILGNLLDIKSKFDLVVSFGVTHHIPDNNFRVKWFWALTKMLNKGGVLVLTFWEFEKSPGDYLIDWGNKNNARYCHQYSKKELKEVTKIFTKKVLGF